MKKKFVQCNLGVLGSFCSLNRSAEYFDQELGSVVGPVYRGSVMSFFLLPWLGSLDPDSPYHYMKLVMQLSFCDTMWYEWIYYALRNRYLIDSGFAPLFGEIALCTLPPQARASLNAMRPPPPNVVQGSGRSRSRSPSFPPGHFGTPIPGHFTQLAYHWDIATLAASQSTDEGDSAESSPLATDTIAVRRTSH